MPLPKYLILRSYYSITLLPLSNPNLSSLDKSCLQQKGNTRVTIPSTRLSRESQEQCYTNIAYTSYYSSWITLVDQNYVSLPLANLLRKLKTELLNFPLAFSNPRLTLDKSHLQLFQPRTKGNTRVTIPHSISLS